MDTSNNVSNLHVLGAVGQAARDAASAQCVDTTAILQSQDGTNLANMANNERLGLNINDNVYRSQIATRDAVERNADWARDAVERNSTNIALAVERTGSSSVNATERSTNQLSNMITHNAGEIKTAQQAIAGETRKQLSENHIEVITSGKDILINENKNTGKILLQASTNAGKGELDIASVKSRLEVQAAQNVAQVQLEALKNKNSISAQLAECCCELKQIVQNSAQTTQHVIQEIENNRVRDALAAINTENLINRLGSSSHHH
jgi:hypothetical protein